MIISQRSMQQIEEQAISQGSSADLLMDIVARGMAAALLEMFGCGRTCIIYTGRGHNGGDALATARRLTPHGWRFAVRSSVAIADLAPLTRRHFDALDARLFTTGACDLALAELEGFIRESPPCNPAIALDGLVGLGAKGALHGPVAHLATEINRLRATNGARVVAMDIPSGLDPDSGIPADPCVVADATLTVAFCKSGMLSDPSVDHVGRLVVIPCHPFNALVAAHPVPAAHHGRVATARELRDCLPLRPHSSHKGTQGRLVLVAGSTGMHGAAALCANASLRAGAGLVTLCCKSSAYDAVASACAPEVMVRPVARLAEALDLRADALAIGPGIPPEDSGEILDVLANAQAPLVADAGALSSLSMRPELFRNPIAQRWILTPHEGEMEKLEPRRKRSRLDWASGFTRESPATLLLKGPRTLIARGADMVLFNPTGNAGMATGGMGDVLTGVIAALLAGGVCTENACALGAWLCGRSADDLVESNRISHESLTASDVSANLGAAFHSLRRGVL